MRTAKALSAPVTTDHGRIVCNATAAATKVIATTSRCRRADTIPLPVLPCRKATPPRAPKNRVKMARAAMVIAAPDTKAQETVVTGLSVAPMKAVARAQTLQSTKAQETNVRAMTARAQNVLSVLIARPLKLADLVMMAPALQVRAAKAGVLTSHTPIGQVTADRVTRVPAPKAIVMKVAGRASHTVRRTAMSAATMPPRAAARAQRRTGMAKARPSS